MEENGIFSAGLDGDDEVVGTQSNDTLYGNDGTNALVANDADTIIGGLGKDYIHGDASDDILYGGTGVLNPEDDADTIDGGLGNDHVYGNGGNDQIIGGHGHDTLHGGVGDDLIIGGNSADDLSDGHDLITGSEGSDQIYGSGGNDTIYGGHGIVDADDAADTIDGGAGNDLIYGNGGDDVLIGGDGNDTLYGGFGRNTLTGGAGDDVFFINDESLVTDQDLGETSSDDPTSATRERTFSVAENQTIVITDFDSSDTIYITSHGNIRFDDLSIAETVEGDAQSRIIDVPDSNSRIQIIFSEGTNPSILNAQNVVVNDGQNNAQTNNNNNDVLPSFTPTIHTHPIPNGPYFEGLADTISYTEDALTALQDFAVQNMQGGTITVTLSDAAAGALNTETIGTATSNYDAINGVWSVTGDQADINAILKNLQFTPSADYDLDLTLLLEGTATNGLDLTRTVTLQATGQADAITLANPIVDQSAEVGVAYSFTPPANTFADPDTGDTIAYSAVLNGGGGLPGWLSIDATTGELSGTPTSGNLGTITVDITATDSQGNSVTDTFDLQVQDSLSATNNNQTRTYVEDVGVAFNAIDVTSLSSTIDVTITLSDVNAGALSTGTSGSVTSMFDGVTGAWSASGAIANVEALLANITFTPTADYDQNLTASVSIDDGINLPLLSTITLNANAINDAPTVDSAILDQIITATNPFSYDASGNFTDVDTGDTLTYSAELSGGGALPGWLSIDVNTGVLSGTPGLGDIAVYDVRVIATDSGGLTVNDVFSLDVSAGGLIIGTPNADSITGSGIADTIYGQGDNDTINAGGARDEVYGEDGDDIINGGNERDTIEGGDGNDTIIGGSYTSNQDREDSIFGNDGDDWIHGGYHHDPRLDGGAGNDTISGGWHNDRLYAGDGTDWLFGGRDTDYLYGQQGTNTLIGGSHRDLVYGGTGADTFLYTLASQSTEGARDTIYNFTQGTDIIDLSLLGYTDISDLTITTGGTTTIRHAGDGLRIDLQGNYTLTNADFQFAGGVADNDIPDHGAQIGAAYSYTIPANTFSTIDDGNLTYTAFTSDGEALPYALTLDTNTGVFNATFENTHAGVYNIIVRAENGSGDISYDTFTLTVANSIITGTVNDDTLTGTGDVDAVYGLGANDSVSTGAGNDAVYVLDGNDTVDVGDGDDTVYGGNGLNSIVGGIGDDYIVTGDHNDTIIAGPDNTNNDHHDTVYAGAGDDYIEGGRRDDRLYGEDGNDTIIGGYHNDRLYGGDGNDYLEDGVHGNDSLYGGNGNDTLDGGVGNDRLYGEAGTNFIKGGAGRDSIYGGTGTDIIQITTIGHSSGTNRDTIYNFAQGADRVDLSELGYTSLTDFTVTTGGTTTIEDAVTGFRLDFSGNYTLTNADFVFAPLPADSDILDQSTTAGNLFSITLDANHFISIDDGNLIYTVTSNGGGLPGWLTFNTGTETLSGTPLTADIGYYDITIRAINGSGDIAEDTFQLLVGQNIITGTALADTLAGTAAADVITGLDDDDSITGGGDGDIISADAGNDTVHGGDGQDTINAGDGDDSINGGNTRDLIYGGAGNDTLIGGGTTNTDHQDTIYGEDGNDYIDGGYHHDTLYGGSGNDTLYGGNNNDTLYGGTDNDSLHGGNNEDRLYGESGNNIFNGWHGRDSMYGGTGEDIFIISQTAHSNGNQRDTIYNFSQGNDLVDLSALGYTDISDFTITTGGTTRVEDAVTGFRLDFSGNYTLTNADFIFSVPAADGDLVRETAQTGLLYNLAIPGGHFASIDDGNLTYQVSLSNGDILPSWLTYDPATGAISGTPSNTDTGVLDITIRATNGTGTMAEDSFDLMVAENIINGTPGQDTLNGTAAADLILADADDDSVTGSDGADLIYGEAGNDSLYGQADQDELYGGDGTDYIHGGDARDTIYGGNGGDTIIGGGTGNTDHQDRLYGDVGDDYIDGGYHHDTIYGGADNDTIYGNRNNDSIYGEAGSDLLHGGNDVDRIYGGDGNDLLIGWHHRDSLYGGDGDDIFMISRTTDSSGGNRDRIFDFVQGEDVIDLSDLNLDFTDLTVNDTGTVMQVTAPTGLRIDIEDTGLTLTAADFIFNKGAADQEVATQFAQVGNTVTYNVTVGTHFSSINDGNVNFYLLNASGDIAPSWITIDRLSGGITATPTATGVYQLEVRAVNGSHDLATDEFVFYVGDNTVATTGAGDTLDGTNATDDLIDGGLGNDSLSGLNGNDGLIGGAGDDTLLGGNNDDYLDGGDNDDSIDGGWHRDLIYGGDGNDTLIGGPDNTNNDRQDTIYGGDGDDSIHGGRYHDLLYGEDGNDTIIGGIHNDTIYGGDGNDTIIDANHGHDRLYGGNGDDNITAGTHNDQLYGGDGNDTLDGGNNNDSLYGGDGADTLTSGTGTDRYIFTSETETTNAATDVITDFTQGNDKIDLSAFGLTDINDLTITDDGTDSTITFGATFELTVEGLYTFAGTDFIF